MPSVTFEHVRKRFGESMVVEDFDLVVADGELLVLVGGSGSGKSTILRMVAGLEEVTSGTIRIDERDVTPLPPRERDVAMVFQDYGLYPHMTVRENLSLGLRLRKIAPQEIDRRVTWAAGMLGLEPLLDRKPKQLSGGQRQRVAMGRAMVREPKVFLFDEPLSNLDAGLRAQMRIEIGGLQRRLKTTTIYVTHDQVEAMTMADRIVIMNAGRIEQIGTPEDVYERPNSEFVARFIGASNVISATHLSGHSVEVAGHTLEIGQGSFAGPGKPMSFCVKTHDVELLAGDGIDADNTLPGTVRGQAYLGSHRDYIVDVGQDVLIAAPAEVSVPDGSKVRVRFKAERCRGLVN